MTNPTTVRILGDLPDGSFIVVNPGVRFADVCEKLRIEREPLITLLESRGLRIVLSAWISVCLDHPKEPVEFSLTSEWQVLPIPRAPAPLRAAKDGGERPPRPPVGAGDAAVEAVSSAVVISATLCGLDPAPMPTSEVRALFCGSREWTDRRAIEHAIKSLPAGSVVIHGNTVGADIIAGELAASYGLEVLVFKAD